MSVDVPSLESLIKQVKARDLRINNLFHRMDGFWQANLRSRDALTFFEFGTGPDAAGALEAALAKHDAKKVVKGKKTSDDDLDPLITGNTRADIAEPATDSDADAVQGAPATADAEEADDLIG